MKMGPQEDYIETVFTCKGDFNDPNLHLQLEEFYEGLRSLLLPDSCSEKLILKKVEPWNSVRVTFNIPRAAALKLKQLAQQGDTSLRRLGVLAVQIEGDQSISLTIAGKNNERTELVFKTGSSDGTVEPSMSVLESTSSGSTVETTRKNIAEYLRQGNALLDPLLSHLGGNNELLKSPNVVATSSDPIPFLSGGSTTVSSTGKNPGLNNSPLHGVVFPAGRSPTGYPTSPGQGYIPAVSSRNVLGSISQSFSSYPHGRTGAPVHTRQTIGNLLLPPPPPYPHPQVVSVNNIQKQTRPMTSSSPLLVNLLQNDPSGGLLHSLAQGKLPEVLDGSLEALALAKKKRKKKRKKRLAAEAAAREAQMLLESVPNTSVASTSSFSLPGFKKSIKKSKHSVSSGHAADHSTNLPDGILESASDKLVNPYTGLLEPADASGDSTSGSSAVPDQPEKIDTIQAAINRVAAAWTAHVTVAGDTASIDTSSVLTSSFPEISTTITSATSSSISLPPDTPPMHSIPCSSPYYISPLSAAPPFSKGTVSDTLASSSVCDRPTNDPHHRPYDMNYSQSNKNNMNSTSDSLHREPLLAMQHVTYSVGIPSGPRPVAPLPTPSHMQPQLSMQETFVPKPSQAVSRATMNISDPLFSRSGGLPGGHSALSSTMLEKSKVLPTPAASEMPLFPSRRHAGTPPHSVLGSPPMTSQAERPRSTGSYPLSRAGDGKGLAEVVSKMLPHFQSGSAYVHPGSPGPHSIQNEHTRGEMQPLGSCLMKNPPHSSQAQNVPPFLQNVPPSESQLTYGNPKIEMAKKGSDEINNSNHDSGLSSQSEAADENQLTDETASSCGTQGSPSLTVSDGRPQVRQESQALTASVVPTSSIPLSSHHQALLSGNPLYHKNLYVQAMVKSAEAATPHNPVAVSKNPTVLHWNTRVQVSSGSHVPELENICLSAEKDSQQGEQQNVLLPKQYEKEQTHQGKCQSPEIPQTLPSVKDGLIAHSRDSDLSSCRTDIPRLSVNQIVSSVSDVRDTSHSSIVRDKGIITASPYRTHSHAPLTSASPSYCGGETYGNYHKDIGRTVPIMSASVYRGHEGKAVGDHAEVKSHLQSSAIGVVPGLPDMRTAKIIDNASSACSESHMDATSMNVRLRKHPFQDEAMDSVSSSPHVHHTFKAHPDPVPKTGAVSTHGSMGNLAHAYPSSVDTHSVNSHGMHLGTTMASQWKEAVTSRTHNVATACTTVVSENCRPNIATPARGHGEALNYNQHYANPLNVHMCNTTSSVSTSSILEPACAVTPSTASMTVDRFGMRPIHSHVTSSVARTSVSQSPVKLPQVHEVASHPDVNGPRDGVERASLQRDIANCHGHDSIGQESNINSLETVSKSGALHMPVHSALPVITGEILEQEFLKNCNSNDQQMLEENAVQSFYTAEANMAFQRGILAGGKSLGVPTASLQAGSPDHLKGSNVTSMYTRKSPTSKPGGGGNMLNMFASVLPLPKLLTESIQKVVKPLPGSAKDVEGSVKVARRNQGPSHTNLLSHSAGSSYSKSPPLGYDTVQGASSMLTPPKSPVRYSPGETVSMGLPKPQSPRTKSPHIHVPPAPNNPPALTHSNMSIPVSINSGNGTKTNEQSVPNDGSDQNGQDIQKREPIQPNESLNSGFPSAQGYIDSVHVQSWNGANSQTSGQQQSTCEHISVETNHARVELTTGSVGAADTCVSESNTFTSNVTASTVQEESSAIQTSRAEQSGEESQTGISEHSEAEEGGDLCKANLSCPSESSIMHPTMSVETPPVSASSVTETLTDVSKNVENVQLRQIETTQSHNVQESAESLEDPVQSTASSGNPKLTGAEEVAQKTESVSASGCVTNVDELTNPLGDKTTIQSEMSMPKTFVEAGVGSATSIENPPTGTAMPAQAQQQPTNESTMEATSSCEIPATVMLTVLPEKDQPKETLMKAASLVEEYKSVEENGKSKLETDSEEAPEVNLLPPPSIGRQESVPEAQTLAPAEIPVDAAVIPKSTELSTLNRGSDLQKMSNEVHSPFEDKTPTSNLSDSIPGSAEVQHSEMELAATVDGTVAATRQDDEPQKSHRNTRKSSEVELPPITKTLRGGKQIEPEPTRASRATKTPKRKDEDNGSKTSPESEASLQVRQRRSRRRLPEAEGNTTDHSIAKRSRVDGVDDVHLDHVDQDGVLIDGESNDSASCDHNDIGESTDYPVIESAPVDNAHLDATVKNVNDDKSGTRLKDTRRGGDALKPILRDSKRDVKQNATIIDNDMKGRGKASERVLRANEEEHNTRSSRRNRQSPSGVLDKTLPASRDRSPMSRTRNRTPDQREESPDQQYKRTTRSTKPKEHPEPVTMNRRRRTSRDHR